MLHFCKHAHAHNVCKKMSLLMHGHSAPYICPTVRAPSIANIMANTVQKALAYVPKMHVACLHNVPHGHAKDVCTTRKVWPSYCVGDAHRTYCTHTHGVSMSWQWISIRYPQDVIFGTGVTRVANMVTLALQYMQVRFGSCCCFRCCNIKGDTK